MLKPVKLALELKEVALPWKKILRLAPRSSRKGRDREYRLEEIGRLFDAASPHIRLAIMFMASSGTRVGAFDFLDVGHIKPLTKEMLAASLGEKLARFDNIETDPLKPLSDESMLLCGIVKVYAGEGDDEYETLISKAA